MMQRGRATMTNSTRMRPAVIGGIAALLVTGCIQARQEGADPVSPDLADEPQKSGVTIPPLLLVSPPLFFGYLAPESFATGVMTMMNDSDQTLQLIEANGDCTCTVPLIEKLTLEPGEATDIMVELNAPTELGLLRKLIFITAEGFDAPVQVEVAAEIGHEVRVNGGLGRSLIVELEGTYRLDAVDEKPFRIEAINGVELTAADFEDFDPAVDEPRNEYVIRFNFRKVMPERLPRFIVIETDHPQAQMFSFPAFLPGAQPLPADARWFPRKKHLLVNDMPGGEWNDASLVIAGALPQQGDHLAIFSSNPNVAAKVIGVERPDFGQGMRINLQMMMGIGTQGFHTSVLNIQMGDEHFATFDLFIRLAEGVQVGQGAPEQNR